jgi:hypothetical protein
MASLSGFFAAQALAEDSPEEIVAKQVNEGIGHGFSLFWPISVFAFIIAWA